MHAQPAAAPTATPAPVAHTPPEPTPPGQERRLARLALLAAAAVLVVAWATVAAVLVARHEDAVAAEIRQNLNLARALEEQTLRVLATADQALVRTRDTVVATGPQALQAGGAQAPDLVRMANETGMAPKILVQLALGGADGRFLFSNLDPDGKKTGPVDLSQREHFRAHLAPHTLPEAERPRGPDQLFIGKPVLGKVSKRWTIQLSRRVGEAGGPPLAVAIASLDPSYFEAVYSRVAMGQQGSVALVGSDLNVRARVVGGQAQGMGSTLPANSGFARHIDQTEGHYRTTSALDGVDRILAFRKVGPYPLTVVVSTATAEALASWRGTRNIALVLTGLLSLAVAAGTAWFVFSLRRMERSNQALRRSEAQANAANHAKSEFLAAISHELRTPLTSIRGFAELMEHRLQDERFKPTASLIRKGAEHLNTLLTEILDLSKVEAGMVALEPKAQPLAELLQGSVDFFSLTAADKALALHLEQAPGLPVQVLVDGLRFKQILNNLLSNALKFTQQGSVCLRAKRDGAWLVCEVQDTGPGIPLDKQALIFERFRQADAQVSSQHGGTGLGLALSRGLAELMGGTLTVQSSLGEGACFTLRLPMAPA